MKLPKKEEITISACPTVYEEYKDKINLPYKLIPTNSTAESIRLLDNNIVDFALAGRTLKNNEGQKNTYTIRKGFAFIGIEEKSILLEDLVNYKIYTDLDINEIKEVFNIKELQFVDNVYDYIDKGVIITSWENLDYSKANIIHILDKDRKRVRMSRQPTLICSNNCSSVEMNNLINNLNK